MATSPIQVLDERRTSGKSYRFWYALWHTLAPFVPLILTLLLVVQMLMFLSMAWMNRRIVTNQELIKSDLEHARKSDDKQAEISNQVAQNQITTLANQVLISAAIEHLRVSLQVEHAMNIKLGGMMRDTAFVMNQLTEHDIDTRRVEVLAKKTVATTEEKTAEIKQQGVTTEQRVSRMELSHNEIIRRLDNVWRQINLDHDELMARLKEKEIKAKKR